MSICAQMQIVFNELPTGGWSPINPSQAGYYGNYTCNMELAVEESCGECYYTSTPTPCPL